MDAKMTDNVNSPSHYARYRFECEPKDLTKYLPHPLASAVEYIIRAPFKGSELEDLQKARFWLLEFVNTDDFWVTTYDSDGSHPYFCRLLPNTADVFKVTACSFALLSKCKLLQRGLCGYTAIDFPRIVYKEQILMLIDQVSAEIDYIESKSNPSE